MIPISTLHPPVGHRYLDNLLLLLYILYKQNIQKHVGHRLPSVNKRKVRRRTPMMKITFRDLWQSSGTIDRGAYALAGLLGFALKHNLDRFVAGYGFHR